MIHYEIFNNSFVRLILEEWGCSANEMGINVESQNGISARFAGEDGVLPKWRFRMRDHFGRTDCIISPFDDRAA